MILVSDWVVWLACASLLALAAALFVGCTKTTYTGGVPNLVQVEPGLWRSGQPTTPAQWAALKKLGIVHVVKLNFDSEGSDNDATAAGMTVYHFNIQPEGDKDLFSNIEHTFAKPDARQISGALSTMSAGGGVLVHCTHGQDRTGLLVGLWRVMHSRWTKDAAYVEMLERGFHPELHGLHEFWEGYEGPPK